MIWNSIGTRAFLHSHLDEKGGVNIWSTFPIEVDTFAFTRFSLCGTVVTITANTDQSTNYAFLNQVLPK